MFSALALGAGLGLVGASPFILNQFGARNGIFLTQTREGTAQAIMNGGRFSHFVMERAGYRFRGGSDPIDRWDIIEETRPLSERLLSTCANWVNPFGWRYVGLPGARNVHTYEQTWRETRPSTGKEGGDRLLLREDEPTNFVYVINFPYGMLLPDGEDSDGIPLIVEYVALIRVTNPYKAIFGNTNWPKTIEERLNELTKDYVGDKTYSQLIREKTSKFRGGEFSDRITAEQDDVEEEFGVRICQAFLLNIDPHPEYREATTVVALAKIQADAAKEVARQAEIEARGQANVVKIGAKAEKGRIETVYGAIGERLNGEKIRRLEALEQFAQGGGTVVVSRDDILTPAAAGFLGSDGKPMSAGGKS